MTDDDIAAFLLLKDWRRCGNKFDWWLAPIESASRLLIRYWTLREAYELAQDPDSPYIWG